MLKCALRASGTWPLAGAKEQHAASCSQQVLSGSRASGVKNAPTAPTNPSPFRGLCSHPHICWFRVRVAKESSTRSMGSHSSLLHVLQKVTYRMLMKNDETTAVCGEMREARRKVMKTGSTKQRRVRRNERREGP